MADSVKQKEYNELLKSTQSLLGSITKSMSDLSKETDKRNKKLQTDLDITKEIFSMMKEEKDVESAINLLVEQRNKILKTNYGANQKLKNSALGQLDTSISILKSHQADIEILKGVGAQLDANKDKANEFVDELSGKLGKIPLIGKGLQSFFKPFFDKSKKIIGKTFEIFGTGFAKSFGSATGTKLQRFNAGLKGGLGDAKTFLNKINPGILKFAKFALIAGAAIFVLKKAFDLAFASFNRIEGAAKSFREQTGLLNSQTVGLKANLVAVESQMAFIGANAQLVAEAAGEFTNEFDGLVQPSQEVLSSMIALNKSLGVGFSEAAKVTKVFRNLGDLTEDQAMNMTLNVGQMAKLAGVAPQKVMADIADSSSEMYKFFGGSGDAMAATAVEAAKLGSSIKEVTKLSSDLLDYDSSINKELEASALLGTNLNFSQARYLAATNDTLGAYKAVGAQLDQLGDLTKLNLYEQQSIEQATGQQFQDLVNQQKIRQKFTNLDAEQLKIAQQYLKANGDLNGLTKERLNDQALEVAKQNEMNSRTEALSNKFASVKTNIQNAFLPLAERFFPVLEGIASFVTDYIAPAFEFVGDVVGGIVSFIGHMKTGLEENKGLLVLFGAALVPLTIKMGVLAVQSIITAVGAIFRAFSMIPFGIGIPLAIAAVAGMISLISSAKGASKAGDVMSPADGKTRISTKEGGLFELSPNDDVMAAPGLMDAMSGREKRAFSRAEMNLAPLLQKMDSLIAATKGNHILVADGKQLATSVSYNEEISLRNNFGINQSKSNRT